MRSQKDPEFSAMCDRIGNGTYNEDDIDFLTSGILNTDRENPNENFKNGKNRNNQQNLSRDQ